MKNAKLGRREMLIALATSAIGAGALEVATPVTALAAERKPELERGEGSSVVGAWNVKFRNVVTQLVDEALVVFAPGGGLHNVQTDFPTSGLGAWAPDRESGFTFTLVQWDYRDGIPPFRVILHGKGHVSDGPVLTGTYTSEVTRRGVLVLAESFEFSGTRAKPA